MSYGYRGLRVVAVLPDGRNDPVDDLLEQLLLLLQGPDRLQVLFPVVLELLLEVADFRRQRFHLEIMEQVRYTIVISKVLSVLIDPGLHLF